MKINQKGFSAVEGLLTLIVVLLIVFVGYYIWHSQSQTSKTLSAANTVAQSSPSKGSVKNNDLIKYPNNQYPNGGEMVATATDISKLTGAPVSFKEYLGKLVGTKDPSDPTCTTTFSALIEIIYRQSYVFGDAGYGCGGANTIWSNYGGSWHQTGVSQSLFQCSDLEKDKVPSTIGGTECLDASDNEQAYSQA